MKKNLKKIITHTVGILFLLIFNNNVYAKCNKEDINYYLEKGFTTEQVTALCSGEVATSQNPMNDIYKSFGEEYADEQDLEYLKKMRVERQVFLKSAIGAQKVRIKDTFLSYETEMCGRNSIKKSGSAEGSNIEGCATIRTEIDLANIEVSMKEKREKIFFGTKEILVKGSIKYRVVGGLTNLTPFEKKILKPMIVKKLKKGETKIPIRSGLDFTYALENFIDIVDFHKGLVIRTGKSNNLGGNLEIEDFDVKDNNYIIEDTETKLNFSNEVDDTVDGNIVFDDLSSTQKESDEIPEDVFN